MKISAKFLQDTGARGIIAALRAAGDETRFVGGCVRDAIADQDSLLNVSASSLTVDIDLATTALPEKVLEVLCMVGFTAKPLGARHGVIFAYRDGQKYEVATLREDVQADGRHAVVVFTHDWEVDARRRDFTVNALSADVNGNVFDYVGGIEDLQARRVRFIGDPTARVREDYLRILRYYRFHARFGADWDAAARAACRENHAGLVQLSRERMTDELCKLLSLENPLAACVAMTEDKILADVVPELFDVVGLQALLEREKVYGRQNWHVRLAAWGGLARQYNEIFLDRFTFSRAAQTDLKTFCTLDYQRLGHALHHFGANAVRAAVMLRAEDATLPGVAAHIENYVCCDFPLQAEDVLQMGVVAGPRLGEILRAVEDWWLKNDRIPDIKACKVYAETLATVSNA